MSKITHDDQERDAGYSVGRVGISLPCSLPVIPGTPNTDAPLSERTEKWAEMHRYEQDN